MKNLLTGAAAALLLVASSPANTMAQERVNPFLTEYTTPFKIPPFDKIQPEDYMDALEKGIEQQRLEIEAIVTNPEEPTFDNTILALEKSGKTLDKVARVFISLDEAMSTPETTEIANDFLTRLSQWNDQISMDERVFARIKNLYERRATLGLNTAQMRALEKAYDDAVRQGAMLSDSDKARLQEINTRLTDLYLKFNKNLLNATNAFEIVIADKAELAGLPNDVIESAAYEAKRRGHDGQWAFTVQAPSRLPVLQNADNRELRKKMYQGYTSLASSGEFDNRPIIGEILKARTQKARLLGYPDYASYMTANVMAKTPKAAKELLMQIWTPATQRVDEELAEMKAVAGFDIEPWDYYYYAEKVRQQKYALNESDIKPYFQVDSVRKGIFALAKKLYGLTFNEIPDAPKYHPDVKVYEVLDADNSHLAIFMTDYFARPSKRQGAWMDLFQGSFIDPDGTVQRPIIYNVGNYAAPTPDSPSLLTIDNVETTFHEFGHALHGMLTRAALRSQEGTNTDRDYVEMPSQIHEHWAFTPELLREYARHYQTGEVIPDSLVKKIEAAGNHNMGFMTTELAGAALLDLAWGELVVEPDDVVDVDAFEAKVASDLKMPRQITYRYRSPYFKHIFGSDGYASGYYTYLWAETLDRDAFDLFEQNGVFDPETARRFRQICLEPGGSEDPMTLYVTFRGHKPSVEPLLKGRGLVK